MTQIGRLIVTWSQPRDVKRPALDTSSMPTSWPRADALRCCASHRADRVHAQRR